MMGSGVAGASPPADGAEAAWSEGSPMLMIGAPTSAVSPAATWIAVTTPAYGEGSSTTDLAVSTSTSGALISTLSPTFMCQATISASVRPSPTSGSVNCCGSPTGTRIRVGGVDGVEDPIDVG